MRRILLIALVLLAGCASNGPKYDRNGPPITGAYEMDGDVYMASNGVWGYVPSPHLTPARVAEIDAEYKAPDFSDDEKAMFWQMLLGHGLDIWSTRAALRLGCVEGNSLFGRRPSVVKMVVIKGLPVMWWAWEAYQSPKRFDTAHKVASKLATALPYAAATWNAAQIAKGCL